MREEFQIQKEKRLGREDHSSIGKIDEKIKDLCNTINSKKSIFTLSSCSGRIVLLEKSEEKTKLLSKWHYVSHEISNPEKIYEIISITNNKNTLWLRQESAILHLCLEDLKKCEEIIHIAKKSGFERGHIISSKKYPKIELIMKTPIQIPVKTKEILVSEKYIKFLLDLSNERLKQNWEILEIFRKNIINKL